MKLPPGTISNARNHIFSLYDGKRLYKKAASIFFENFPKTELPADLQLIAEGYFNEWLLFDLDLGTGKSLLETYYEYSFNKLTQQEKSVYEDMITTEHYILFEITKVVKNVSVTIKDLLTGKVYLVNEQALTKEIKIGDQTSGRLVRQKGEYVFVSANPVLLPIAVTSSYLEMKLNGEILDAKWFFEFYCYCLYDAITIQDSINVSKKPPQLEEAKRVLDLELTKAGIIKIINSNKIIRILNSLKQKDRDKFFNLMLGIVGNTPSGSEEAIFHTTANLMNSLLPPAKASSKKQQKFEIQNFTLSWLPLFELAHESAQSGDFKKSAKLYEDTIKIMIEEFSIAPEPYRLIANYAVSLKNSGQSDLADYVLDLALELNPNYDFGLTLKKQFSKFNKQSVEELMKLVIPKALTKSLKAKQTKSAKDKLTKSEISSNPATKLIKYIQELDLNFKTDKLTKSKVTTISR